MGAIVTAERRRTPRVCGLFGVPKRSRRWTRGATRARLRGAPLACLAGATYKDGHAEPIRTKLCDLLGIEHPICSWAWGASPARRSWPRCATPAASVSWPGCRCQRTTCGSRLRRCARSTHRPFGVNLWLHEALQPPADVAQLPETDVRAVQDELNVFRARVGSPQTHVRPVRAGFDPGCARGHSRGSACRCSASGSAIPGGALTARCHERGGMRAIAMAATVEDALCARRCGRRRDCGTGRRGRRPSLDVCEARARRNVASVSARSRSCRRSSDAVSGAGDCRRRHRRRPRPGLPRCALGAQAVMLGTRFVATRESMAPLVLQAGDSRTRQSTATLVHRRVHRPVRARSAQSLRHRIRRKLARPCFRRSAQRTTPA